MNAENILTVISLGLSISSLVASVAAIRYAQRQALYAEKQYELAREEFETQTQKQQFTLAVSDTYYFQHEDYSEILGAIINLSNPTPGSVFVKYLKIQIEFFEFEFAPKNLPLWQFLLFRPEGTKLVLNLLYPSSGWRSMSGSGSRLFSVSKDEFPTCWIFNRTTDNLLDFNVAVEIPSNSNTALWELVVQIPRSLRRKIKGANLEANTISIIAVLNEDTIEQRKARFSRVTSMGASDGERVKRLIESASILLKK